jgi:hypothetical protein
VNSFRQFGVVAAIFAALFAAAVCAHGEDLTLKSGEKISGAIVGFENGMFRVKTSYGYALVRKSDVVKISFEKSAGKNAEAKPAQPSAPATTSAAATSSDQVSNAPPPGDSAPAQPPAPPVSRPINVPFPKHVEESIEGPDYVNSTFRFALFKPLEWKMLDEVPKETGSGVMAMADEDGQTVVVVDRQVWSGPPDIHSDQVEARLRQSYEEYKMLGESSAELDGRAALRRKFEGVVDGVEWHGISVHFAVGNAVYGIIGVTSAEQYQFQQDVIEKIIRSFHILPSSAHSS